MDINKRAFRERVNKVYRCYLIDKKTRKDNYSYKIVGVIKAALELRKRIHWCQMFLNG